MNPTSDKLSSLRLTVLKFMGTVIELLAIWSILGLTACSLIGFAGEYHWLLDLFNHMRMHLLVASFLLILLMIWRRNYRWFWIATGCCLLNVVVVQPWDLMIPHDRGATVSPVRLLSWNVLWANQDMDRTADEITKFQADVVALIEYTEVFSTHLDELKVTHPHFIELPAEHAFGVAVFSRHPCEFKTYQLASGNIPVVKVTLRKDDVPVEIWVAHVYPPMGSMWGYRGRQLEELTALLQASAGEHVVLCGDFNDTPWSRTFRRLSSETQLRDARTGFGYQASWPRRLGPLGIPIDHVLVSSTIGISQCDAEFQPVDSDHAAVFTEFGLLERK